MCDDDCEKFSRKPCQPCKTINLARIKEFPQVHHDPTTCVAPQPCLPVSEIPVKPVCIKVCTRDEYWAKVRGLKPAKPPLPHVGHGKTFYLVKAAILAGAAYWTVRQGIWGDQQDMTEAINRWQEYIRSINTRRPPTFDTCGNVIVKEQDSVIAPLYAIYKSAITTVFAGIVKFPVVIKCMYVDYLNQMEMRQLEQAKARKLKR